MRWLENIFGLSPDGGSGATEAAFVLAVVIAIGATLAARVHVFQRWRTK